MRLLRSILIFLLSIACLCSWSLQVCAADEDLEYKIKAAFLLNFAKFSIWPETAWTKDASHLRLCIVGSDPFGTALQGVEEKQVAGKTFVLHRGSAFSSTSPSCQLLFVSKSEQGQLDRILKANAGKPVVTVSDIEGFAEQGGIFEFKNKDGRLSFVINNSKAKENGVHISASLLSLAIEVL